MSREKREDEWHGQETGHSKGKMPPTWTMVLGSVLILGHLVCAFLPTLAQYNGPWVNQSSGQVSMSRAPELSVMLNDVILPYHTACRINHGFHFPSIRQEMQELWVEVALKNDQGIIQSKLPLPDPTASSAIQYRQRVMAQFLGGDEELPPMQGVQIAAAGKELQKTLWWQPETETKFILKADDPNTVPRNQMLRQPSPRQMTLVRSFNRYLAAQHPGKKVEIIRYWQNPVEPIFLLPSEPEFGPESLRRFQSSYGELAP